MGTQHPVRQCRAESLVWCARLASKSRAEIWWL